jgi:hypothetical protein
MFKHLGLIPKTKKKKKKNAFPSESDIENRKVAFQEHEIACEKNIILEIPHPTTV